MKIAEYKNITKKKSKYHNEKSGGYDSKKEHSRAVVLHLMEKRGLISDLREQVTFELIPAQYVQGFNRKLICARRAMKYVADFVYVENGKFTVEDSKGFKTVVYKQKKRLMKRIYNIEIKET